MCSVNTYTTNMVGHSMMEEALQADLEAKTRSYWRLSRTWHGRDVQLKVSAGHALTITNTLLQSISPQRAAHKAVTRIEDEIIRNKRTKKAKKLPKNTVSLWDYKLLKTRREADRAARAKASVATAT